MPEERLIDIKNEISDFKGQSVIISSRVGRRGMMQKKGVVENAYPDIFIVSVNEDGYCKKYCYAYADILTRLIEITPLN